MIAVASTTALRSLSAAMIIAAAGLALTAPPAMARASDDQATMSKPTTSAGAQATNAQTASTTKGVALIEIEHSPSEEPSPLAWLFGGGDKLTLRELIGRFELVARDPAYQVLVVRLRGATLRTTQIEEIGTAMQAVRAAGKKVHLFADGYETPEFLLGSYADELVLQAGGAVSLPGMHMEEMYLADTMAWAGLVPQMVQIGDYKGANEQYMNAKPTEKWSKCIDGLLDGLYGNVRDRLKSARKLDDAKLDDAMRQAWMASGQTARTVGLIDSEVDLPALSAHLEQAYATKELDWKTITPPRKAAKMDMSNPFALMSKLMKEPDTTPKRESLAIIHINGPIVDGESSEGGFTGGKSVGSVTIRRAIEEIAEEDLFKGVIVRINSPGGSAIASEVIWQGVKRLAEKKPVWVSVGSMAASGGYYIAVSGQKIYVNPSSIVGSIGVVGGKIAMGGLYDKANIRTFERSRGPLGNMMSSAKPWDTQQIAMVRLKMQETYDLFTKRVAAGRPGIELGSTAEGRLFTGNQAILNKMADKVGGLTETTRDLAASLNLAEGSYDLMDFPGPRAFMDVIGESMGMTSFSNPSGAAAPAEKFAPAFIAGSLKQIVGPAAWPSVRDAFDSFMQLREQPILLTTPSVIIVR